MVVLATAGALPKRIGYHALYKQSNAHGAWSIRVEPEGFQIDAYHDPKLPHAHRSEDYEHPVPLPGLVFERALAILEDHLRTRGQIVLTRILEELKR